MFEKIFLIAFILIIFLGTILIGNIYYPNLLSSIQRKNIEVVGRDGFGNSLLLNSLDEPKASYIQSNGNLVFAEKTNGIWRKEVIVKNGLPGPNISLARDRDDNYYILYFTKEGSLSLATKEKNSWKVEEIFYDASLSCNLVFDNNDIPHISFWSPQNGLLYGTKENGKWKIDIIDYGKVGWWNDLFLDKEDNPHISYFDFERKSLLYLYFNGNYWKKETVDFGEDVGRYNSIYLERGDVPIISYFNAKEGILKVAKKSYGGWILEKVDSEGIVGEETNITGKDQNFIISYVGLSDNSFRIAEKVNDKWHVSIIDKKDDFTAKNIKGEIGGSNSVFLDRSGKLHLLWQDLLNDKLKYIKR